MRIKENGLNNFNNGRMPFSKLSCVKLTCKFAALLMVVAAIGCGGGSSHPTTTLSGKVTIDGKPIPAEAEAFIQIRSTKLREVESVSAEIVDGSYTMEGAPQGEVLATFSVTLKGPEKFSERTQQTYREETSLVPAETMTGVNFTVDSDSMEKDFDL